MRAKNIFNSIKGRLPKRKSSYKISYSQTGEDLILNCFLKQSSGIYIDVGCHDPVIFNNTYLFYKRGWRGINIDANAKYINKFNKIRKKDINICAIVGSTQKYEKFYIFDEDKASTYLKRSKDQSLSLGHKLEEVIEISCLTLNNIFNGYLEKQKIDFLSVDVEGAEIEVFNSNDWKKYRPSFVIAETIDYGTKEKRMNIFDPYFKKIDYVKFADTFINTIYISEEHLKKIKLSIK